MEEIFINKSSPERKASARPPRELSESICTQARDLASGIYLGAAELEAARSLATAPPAEI